MQVPQQLRPESDNTTNTSTLILEEYEPLTMSKVAELNRDVKRLLSDLHRINVRLGVISNQIFKLEKIRIGGQDYLRNIDIPQSFFGRLNQQLNNLWDFKVRRPFNRYIGYLFALLSFILLCCELSIFTGIPINLIHIIVNQNLGYYAEQVNYYPKDIQVQFALIPFVFYIAFCTYYGLFGMKIAGMYSFNKHHQTDAPSLLFGSINFGRVSFPLCYNFIGLTQIKMLTSFSEIIGDMNVIPLFGTTFSFLLPLMLILMCLFNLFNLQAKILNAIGLTSYAEKDHKDVKAAEEGKKVIQQEKKERENRSQVKVSDSENKTPSIQELVPKNVWGNHQNKELNQYMKSFDGILNI